MFQNVPMNFFLTCINRKYTADDGKNKSQGHIISDSWDFQNSSSLSSCLWLSYVNRRGREDRLHRMLV